MSRIDDIIERARDTLNDAAGTRWVTARLLRAVDEGQKEIVRRNKMLRAKKSIRLEPGVADYSTPSDCWSPIRWTHNGTKIDPISHEDLDDLASRGVIDIDDTYHSWETEVADADEQSKYIVFDKLNPGKFKVYPIPYGEEGSRTLEGSGLYGLLITVGDDFGVDSVYGTVADIDDNSGDGLVRNFYNVDPDISGNLGFAVTVESETDDVTVYYYKRPIKITATSDSLEIDEIWDTALKHYITGHVLRDDKDTQNRQVGNEELGFYEDAMVEAKRLASQDFTSTRTQYESPYISGFGAGISSTLRTRSRLR